MRTTATLFASLLALLGACGPAQREGRHTRKLLETFDDLDFNVFSNQRWDQLDRSHARDVVVHWPDGHQTRGLDVHTGDLKKMFVYAPDTRIVEHPVKFGSGDWTCVTGTMQGTFTAPMPAPDGRTIAPTGKAFTLPMCTVGRWRDGKMAEEWLYWDNQAFLNQLGLEAQAD
jgi:ketosteroid isomerase-like protein